MTDKNLKQHPLSSVFPPMSGADFTEPRSDIAANGLCQPIIVYDGAALDGWHRQRACADTGTEPRYENFQGDDDAACKFVVKNNLKTRILNVSQRAMIGAKLTMIERSK